MLPVGIRYHGKKWSHQLKKSDGKKKVITFEGQLKQTRRQGREEIKKTASTARNKGKKKEPGASTGTRRSLTSRGKWHAWKTKGGVLNLRPRQMK